MAVELGYRVSVRWSECGQPTIRVALLAGTPWLDVFCPGCGTSRASDLRSVDRHSHRALSMERYVFGSAMGSLAAHVRVAPRSLIHLSGIKTRRKIGQLMDHDIGPSSRNGAGQCRRVKDIDDHRLDAEHDIVGTTRSMAKANALRAAGRRAARVSSACRWRPPHQLGKSS